MEACHRYILLISKYCTYYKKNREVNSSFFFYDYLSFYIFNLSIISLDMPDACEAMLFFFLVFLQKKPKKNLLWSYLINYLIYTIIWLGVACAGQSQYTDTLISSLHNPELPARMSELVDTSNSVIAKVNGLANHFAKLRPTDHKLIIANED